ncbi:hypothetical protein [Nafulsella turpanensis]|uniref:hypothetical protein n=1 Tax=Nafulsella turpanensis TaxID=1265690 RepID=UPI000369CB17|nr:hypothetical protein [Nafulsella turpanensis]
MKKALLIFTLLLCVTFSGFAQNNIITVPVPEIVPKKKVYVQPGVVVNRNLAQFGTIVSYGLGANFQAGITITDVTTNFGPEETFFPIDSVKPGLNPDVLVNFSKGWKLSKGTWLGIGTMSGFNVADNGADFSSFNYFNGQTKIFKDNLVLLGVYYGNDTRLVTKEGKFGLLAGFKVPLSKKWSFAGDYISGNNARSYINTGFGYKITSHWAAYGGAVIPAPDSGNKLAGTLQFRYLGGKEKKKKKP